MKRSMMSGNCSIMRHRKLGAMRVSSLPLLDEVAVQAGLVSLLLVLAA